ncbi:nucleoside diphosphate-linked moiety X motif 8 isoform X1 [Fundulus heteroclitus]|uniref:nucleoside diphosphate-linked moiety X motif 8 isoform X1 n=1 Tax=Fundulus heteroclitus TaxID=8078 RepID=UPI00165C488A|nr:nucleoside diphosphate-linked moiety X motif 8 isoform X1 [Fundulus heteroclitus]
MLRGSTVLVWACPLRSPWQMRELHLFALSEHIGSSWSGVRHIDEGRCGRICEKGTRTVCCSAHPPSFSADGEKRRPEGPLTKALLGSHYHRAQVSAKTKVESYPFSTFWDCFVDSTFWPRDVSQATFGVIDKSQCNVLRNCLQRKRRSYYSFHRPELNPWILNRLPCQAQLRCHNVRQIRTVHQAAPRVADTWRDCLSPENESRCRRLLQANRKLYDMDKVRKGASQTQGKNKGKWASILVSLCCDKGGPAFLFTLRSCTLKGKHKGDVSFAGGKGDPSDTDVVATALREAREELGVTVPAEKVWGVMKPLRDASGMMIAPVLANLGPLEELTFEPNPEEVDEIFTLSLSHLCNPQNRGYTHFRTGDRYGYTLPVFRNGKHRVWGLTAVALDHTLKLIRPPYGS